MSFGTMRALDSVSLSVRAGSMTALLDKNGSGNSTLIRVLTGINSLRDGSLKLFGRPIALPLTSSAVHEPS